MKRVPVVTACIIAVLSFLSVLGRQTGDTLGIADTVSSLLNYSDDSLQVYSYINQSKKYINKNPDSSLLFADFALKTAIQTNDDALIGDALKQKNVVQEYNAARIKKQNDAFETNDGTPYNTSVLLILISLILFIGCIFFFMLYRRKNILIQDLEDSKSNLELRNKELLLLQKQTDEKNAALELTNAAAPEVNVNINTLKESLVPMLAHDIRSPLASLQHMLTLTRENVLSPEEFQKLSLALEADIYNLRGILDNMLLWTREQMVEIKINKSSFDLSDAMQDIILMHRNNLITKNITIKNYLQPGLMVYSDKDIITAVLRNLFSNAVKFTEENKNVFINQIYFNKKIFISIKDEGKGISDEILEKITKGEHITTKGTSNEKGTGIGLMFTRDLLKKIGETFDITTVPGSGTSATFSVNIHEP